LRIGDCDAGARHRRQHRDVPRVRRGGAASFAISRLEIYLPYAQTTWPNIYVMPRTTRDPDRVAASVRAAVREPGLNRQSMAELRSMEDRIAALNDKPRFNSLLAAAFAVIAALLGAVGVYGVVSYSASQKAQEDWGPYGPRRHAARYHSLDSRTSRTVDLRGIGPRLDRLLRSLSHSCKLDLRREPARCVVIARGRDAVGIARALVASYIPARRAARRDPMAALRSE